MPTHAMKTIVIDEENTELAYLDSGVPIIRPYTTLFAIHGMVFTSRTFFDFLFGAQPQPR